MIQVSRGNAKNKKGVDYDVQGNKTKINWFTSVSLIKMEEKTRRSLIRSKGNSIYQLMLIDLYLTKQENLQGSLLQMQFLETYLQRFWFGMSEVQPRICRFIRSPVICSKWSADGTWKTLVCPMTLSLAKFSVNSILPTWIVSTRSKAIFKEGGHGVGQTDKSHEVWSALRWDAGIQEISTLKPIIFLNNFISVTSDPQ